jgi:hypothetical protein
VLRNGLDLGINTRMLRGCQVKMAQARQIICKGDTPSRQRDHQGIIVCLREFRVLQGGIAGPEIDLLVLRYVFSDKPADSFAAANGTVIYKYLWIVAMIGFAGENNDRLRRFAFPFWLCA